MNPWLLLWEALKFLLLAAQVFLREHLREEGRKEVRDQLEQANEQARQNAEEIDAVVGSTDLDTLRDRMRHHQRPSDAL